MGVATLRRKGTILSNSLFKNKYMVGRPVVTFKTLLNNKDDEEDDDEYDEIGVLVLTTLYLPTAATTYNYNIYLSQAVILQNVSRQRRCGKSDFQVSLHGNLPSGLYNSDANFDSNVRDTKSPSVAEMGVAILSGLIPIILEETATKQVTKPEKNIR